MEADDPAEIQKKSEALAQTAHKLAEVMYAQAQQDPADGEQAGGEPPADDVVDAEFEEVPDDKKSGTS